MQINLDTLLLLYGRSFTATNTITGKKTRIFKVFKVAGKKCITTVKQKLKKKTRCQRSAKDHGEFQQ